MDVGTRSCVLVGIELPTAESGETGASLDELARLVKTLGFTVTARLTQRRSSLTGGTVLGEGKLKELAALTGGTGVVPRKSFAKTTKAALRRAAAQEEGCADTPDDDIDDDELDDEDETPANESPGKATVDAVIFDCELTPSQLVNLEKATGVRVLDRTGVIVEIFSRHAHTREARLQVEIARLRYLAPRIRKTGSVGEDRMSRAGESTLELDRRRIRDRLAELRHEIDALHHEQAEGRVQRAQESCVALVGYTNAGKSSLMRALTGSAVLVEDKLFATLDTTVRTLAPPSIPTVLISDTVGFIKKLPHDLVASFRSTLEEARQAGLLLFVVDASDPSFRSQLAVTREVLSSIGVHDTPSYVLLNKCDRLNDEERARLAAEFPDAILMSTRDAADVAALRETILAFFESDMVEEEVFIPYARQKIAGQLRTKFRVLGEHFEADGTVLRVRAHPTELKAALARWFTED